MNNLARVFTFKIAATVLFWSVPLMFFPRSLLDAAGIPQQPTYMFVRMLGWSSVAATAVITLGLYLWGVRRPFETRT